MQRRLHIILFFLFLSTYTYGQDINYGVWTQAGVSFDIAKDLKASVSEMYRQDLQTPIRRAYITELGLKYDLSKKWSVAGEYRLKLLPSEYRNRIALSANFREGMGILIYMFARNCNMNGGNMDLRNPHGEIVLRCVLIILKM